MVHGSRYRRRTAPVARSRLQSGWRADQRHRSGTTAQGLIALDEKGNLGVFHSTAHRTLLVQPVADSSGVITLSPRANRLLLEQGGKIHPLRPGATRHPEISWSALWGKVWYQELRQAGLRLAVHRRDHRLRTKLSLSPLTFGTPQGRLLRDDPGSSAGHRGRRLTAYFMAPAMRRKVKPVIELMEALPTVILGFFAGLFLAPYVEGHLPGVFSLLLLTPLGILLCRPALEPPARAYPSEPAGRLGSRAADPGGALPSAPSPCG